MVYDMYHEKNLRKIKKRVIIGLIAALLLVISLIAVKIYMEVVQLDEIGGLSGVYLTNLMYKVIFAVISFIMIFAAVFTTNIFIKKNMLGFIKENVLQKKFKLPNVLISLLLALAGSFVTLNFFYQKALNFIYTTSFGSTDPIFHKDIGYFVFQRPFLMAIYDFVSSLWLFVIIYTIAYYVLSISSIFSFEVTFQNLKVRTMIRHNIINIAIFFVIKLISYKFQREGILYSTVVDTTGANVTGASYVDNVIWLNYFTAAPFLLAAIVIVSSIFIWKNKLRRAAITIAVYPAVWILVTISAALLQNLAVDPNVLDYESKYLKYNMEKTREAYNIDKIKSTDFPDIKELTPEIINRNAETKNNIRIVDYKATLESNMQLQSSTNFYTFNDGDIINYNINGKEMPVFMTAREIDTHRLPTKTYINTMFKYTHGYGLVMNPINRVTAKGQIDFVINDLKMNSADKNLTVKEPRIYYGELTNNHVIVNPADSGKLKEIDYDGISAETSYGGKGGIKLGFLNRLIFAARYTDFNMLISGNIGSESKLLLNRNIIERAQKAVPFLTVDNDPYVLLAEDGKIKWVLDAYTTTRYYPYSQSYGDFNYIRNSVKIVIDAYDGTVTYYIIDKKDPIVNAYSKVYPDLFSKESLPSFVAQHMKYPEFLFKTQTEVLKKYHLDPKFEQNVATFYSNQDLWDIAKYPERTGNVADPAGIKDIDPYYNMIKLPAGFGNREELVLIRPFTPSQKNNMVSWLAVRNSSENYGELILFNFSKGTTIYGPYHVATYIDSIEKISADMTLWGQSGSRVFKGSLLVIPIENSVLYVEPIYVQATGPSSIPQMREIVAVYQKGNEFKHGIGADLDEALRNLFGGNNITPSVPGVTTPNVPATPPPKTGEGQEGPAAEDKEKLIKDITTRYDNLKKEMDELGKLLEELNR
ncbi:MAG: UPF0182 family protein [Clostridia bacterium]|nr:UPF0182 family protein [Clostridia bacterium]